MNDRKSLKSLSERFYLKSKKEFENVCRQFSANLYQDISQGKNCQEPLVYMINKLLIDIYDLRYLSEKENNENTSCTFNFLKTALNSTQDDFEIPESASPVMKQSNIIREMMTTASESPDATCLIKALKNLLFDGHFFDIVLKVKNEVFLTHKDVLCARSTYFSAMLQTNCLWTETNDDSITLGGLSSKSFAVYLCHLYGVFVDCSCTDKVKTMSLVQTADMLGSDDMKVALVLFMQRDKCHFFHKPCSDCIEGIPIVLQVSEQFCLDKLQRKCLKWNTQHFSRLWPTKKFCNLPSVIRERCYTAVIDSMNLQSVTNITLEADEVIGHLTVIKWALPVIQMTVRLLDACKDFISQHLFELAETERIFPLFLGMGCRSNLVEDVAAKTSTNLSTSNACTQHLAVRKLLAHAEQEQCSPSVKSCFKSLDQRITNFLTANYYAVIHSEHWALLSADYKTALQAATLCQGDLNRKPRHKPVLSSSVQQPCKSPPRKAVKKKETIKSTRVAAKSVPLNSSQKLSKEPNQKETFSDPALIPVSQVSPVSQCIECGEGEVDQVSSSQETDFVTKAKLMLQSSFLTHEKLLPPELSILPTVLRPYSLEDQVLPISILPH